MKEKTSFQILGKTYYAETSLSPLQIASIARHVEEKILEASSNTDDQTTLTHVVLAALNIAEELFKLQTDYENLTSAINEKADELLSVVERALE